MKIKPLIEKELEKSSNVSGVLIYRSDYQNGRYVENPKADKNIRFSQKDLETILPLRIK